MTLELTRWCPRFVTYQVVFASASRHVDRVHRRYFLAQIEPLPDHIPEELYYSSPFREGGQAATHTPLLAADSQAQSAEDGADSLQPSAAAPMAAPVWQRQQGFDCGSAASEDEYSQHDDLFDSEDSFSDDAAVADPSDADNSTVSQTSWVASPTAAAHLAAVAAALCSSTNSAVEPGRDSAQQILQASPRGIATLGGVMGASLWHKGLREKTLPGVQPATSPLQGPSACSSPMRQSSPASQQQHEHKATPCAHPSQQEARSSRSTGAAVAGSADSEASVLVSKDLLLRYYQLEAFAAEYYTWFISQNAAESGSVSGNTEPEMVL